jgi:uncharacterized protein YbjT (DUF2867 family)
MILVTGPTGNVGKHVVSQLSEAGVAVRALARDPAKIPSGIEAVKGDLSVPETLESALDGVETVFLIWPGFAAETAAPVVKSIAAHARRVVYLSADVEDLADGEEATLFHQEVERLIRHTGLTWTFLRPSGFATNTLGWAEQVRQGVVRWPYGEASRALIHEKDIASVAVHVLTSAGHAGAKYALSGPERLTQAEQVRIIGEAVGREVRWEELPLEVAREQLLAMWGDPTFVEGALAAWGAFVDAPEKITDTVPRLLGRPALTFREWAVDHADAFR